MAKILAVSDIHENIEMLNAIINHVNHDAIFMAGDIAELNVISLADTLSKTDTPVIIISGNHDCVACMEKLAKKYSNVTYVFRDIVSLNLGHTEINMLCISGVYSRKKRDLFHFGDKDILKIARKIITKDVDIDIIMTHTAPYRMADFLPKGGRGGLKQFLVLKDLCNPKFWISGHTHVLASEKVMKTLAVNCGLGYIGDLVLIDLKRKNVMLGRLYSGEIPEVESPIWDFLYYLRRVRSYNRILVETSTLLTA